MRDNRTKSIYSIFTTLWLLVFLMASTSHMGISHHLYIPDNHSSQVHSSENKQNNNKNCPWGYATMMTSGDSTPIDFSYTIGSYHYCLVIQSQFNLSDTYTTSDPRAPPLIFS